MSGSGAQKDGLRTPAEQQRFHLGRLNYLMVDGHVELLSPLQTGSFDGTAGIWTVKKGYSRFFVGNTDEERAGIWRKEKSF